MQKKTVKKRVATLRANLEKRPHYIAAKLMGWDPGVMTKWLWNHDVSLKGLTTEGVLQAISEDKKYPLPEAALRYLTGNKPAQKNFNRGAPGHANRMTIPDKVALLIESVEEHLRAAERCKMEAFAMMQAHYRDQIDQMETD